MKKQTQKKYWKVIAEIDYLFYHLEQVKKSILFRKPIEIMIDKSTGFDEKIMEDFKSIVQRIKKLQSELPADDPHFIV